MDIGSTLVTKIVDEGRLNEVLRSGITEEFLDDEAAAVFNYVRRHFAEYKGIPTRDAVKLAFPSFEFVNSTEPVEYFIDTIKESYRRALFETKLEEIADVYAGDTQAAETILRGTLSSLNVTAKTFQDVSITGSVSDRIEAYKQRKEAPGANGILSGWSTMDNETLGFQPEEFAVVVGEKYMGKSWLIIWLAYQAFLQGERVLMATKEMSQRQISNRFDSVYTQVPFDSLRKGELTVQEEERYINKMTELGDSSFHLVIAREGVHTVEDIETKAIETDATIIFGDSIYLFPPDNRSERLAETAKRLEISHKCKGIASNLGIPFIVSVQAGRKKTKKPQTPDLDNIEWSNAFSQDAETVVYLQKDEIDLELSRAQMHLLKSRDGKPAQFYINQNFEHMMFDERAGDHFGPTTNVFEEDEVVHFEEGASRASI